MIDPCAAADAVSGPRGRACRAFGPDFTQGIWVSVAPWARLPTVELPPGATGPVRRRRARTCFFLQVRTARAPTNGRSADATRPLCRICSCLWNQPWQRWPAGPLGSDPAG